MRTELLNIENIDIYGGTQTRVATNDEAVESYAEAMEAGAEFPPITVFFDGSKYWLADGFHRYLAVRKLNQASIAADIHEGGRSTALEHALGANAENGLYRTNADKRNAVEIALEEWPDKSNGVLAEVCRVSVEMVRKCRVEMKRMQPDVVTGKDGKEYPARRSQRLTKPEDAFDKPEPEGDAKISGGGGRPSKKHALGSAPGGSSAEIEAEARKMIRDGEMDPAELASLRSATASDYAHAAISVLKRIPGDDPQRADALAIVRRWLQTEDAGSEIDAPAVVHSA